MSIVDLCAERGYAAVTVSALIESAGVSRAEFRELYGTREDCFVAAVERFRGSADAAVAAALADPPDTWTLNVIAALQALLDTAAADPRLARLVFVDSVAVAEREEALDAGPKVMESLFAAVRAAHRGSPDPVPGAERAAVGAAAGLIGDAAAAGTREALMETLPDLVYVVTVPFIGQAEAVAASAEALK